MIGLEKKIARLKKRNEEDYFQAGKLAKSELANKARLRARPHIMGLVLTLKVPVPHSGLDPICPQP